MKTKKYSKLDKTQHSKAVEIVGVHITLIFIITHTQKRKSPDKLKTLDIGSRLLNNAAFVRIYMVERFSKDFSEVRELRSREFKL